jgi:L-ribulose-5-phosphate 4-epimerase
MNFESPSVKELKDKVATANRIMAHAGLATGPTAHLGHASARIPHSDYIVMKGRGYDVDALGKMTGADMIVLDLDANVVDGPHGVIPQNEVKMHTRLYRARKDVGGVVHVHPRFAIILSIAGKKLEGICNEGLDLVHAGIPVYASNELICTDDRATGWSRRWGSRTRCSCAATAPPPPASQSRKRRST